MLILVLVIIAVVVVVVLMVVIAVVLISSYLCVRVSSSPSLPVGKPLLLEAAGNLSAQCNLIKLFHWAALVYRRIGCMLCQTLKSGVCLGKERMGGLTSCMYDK